MKAFEFNEHGVCTNPNKYGIDWRNEIRTAQLPDGKWVYGISYNFDAPNYEGGSFGCMKYGREGYNSEREACLGAVSHMREIADRRFRRGHKFRESIDKCCEKVFDQWHQLTLF